MNRSIERAKRTARRRQQALAGRTFSADTLNVIRNRAMSDYVNQRINEHHYMGDDQYSRVYRAAMDACENEVARAEARATHAESGGKLIPEPVQDKEPS